VITLEPGRVLAPRILGAAVDPDAERDRLLEQLGQSLVPPGPGEGKRELADGSRLRLRGRSRELTVLKSLVLGFRAASPGERILILQGEAGLGHDRLCDWAGATAETEGIWVADLDLYPGERAGGLLERLLTECLTGLEAELYARLPAVARALAGRMAAFAFLKGGRRSGEDRGIEPEELQAALEAMAFAQGRHPRMVLLRSLERAAGEIPRLVRDLVEGTGIPWLLSARDAGLGPEAKACLSALRHHPASATVILDRLEDGQIAEVLADLLGAHDLPPRFLEELCCASLGNPGLLQKILELAQLQGDLVAREGRWSCAPDGAVPGLGEDQVAGVLRGRLRQLRPDSLAAVRCLALVDQPLAFAALGQALGLDGDAVEEALHPAVNAKLVLVADGSARIQGPSVRELVLAQMSARELSRNAQGLLAILEGQPSPPVRLLAFALDRETALARVLEGLERCRSGPLEAERLVREALRLGPDRQQEARLWEFQADAWGRATAGDGLSLAGPRDRSPLELALEALERAIQTLGADAGWEAAARLQRKRGLLELRLRRPEAAEACIRRAAALLADHPFHPEQPRLSLARGRLELGRGALEPALAALRSGLGLLGQPGADRRDLAALLLELGRAQGEAGQFQGALASLDPARRLAEQDGDQRPLAEAMDALGQVHLGMGQADSASQCLLEAILVARTLDDPALVAQCQLHLGMLRSAQQLLGPALASLESAIRRFELLGDGPGAAQAQVWKARNLAALGDHGLAELLLMRAASAGGTLTPAERADREFLAAEMAGFMADWTSARRHYQAAANRFNHAGMVWRDRLARLRCIQAEAQEAQGCGPAWIRLEQLKGPVEGSGSRWLELEWQRAHALLLGAGGPAAQTLSAWDAVLAGARELGFPAMALEAGARGAGLLLERGERLAARARIQDTWPSAQELWSRLPEAFGPSFLGRSEAHRFQRAAAEAGMDRVWPERVEPWPIWDPTTVDLSLIPSFLADS
jgi:tetratricopeptide (TPR) repeat protein